MGPKYLHDMFQQYST